MKIPLEYGDNFPVPPGSWNPTVPWRFPKVEEIRSRSRLPTLLLPWVTLGLGVTLGVAWMSWRSELAISKPAGGAASEAIGRQQQGLPRPLPQPTPTQGAPRSKPMRGAKSQLA